LWSLKNYSGRPQRLRNEKTDFGDRLMQFGVVALEERVPAAMVSCDRKGE
jgi:hypothetical protein